MCTFLDQTLCGAGAKWIRYAGERAEIPAGGETTLGELRLAVTRDIPPFRRI
jgi:hypothetical protein